VGFLFSFISAWLCVRWLLRYVSTHNFNAFAWYRIAFGGVILLTAYFNWVNWAD
jgi:undecaprenyl-diphosphatase